MLLALLQIVIGLVIVYIIYLMASLALASDDAKGMNWLQDARRDTVLLNGLIDAVDSHNRVFETTKIGTVSTGRPYLSIPRSINRIGGAQFSYSFWMYLDDRNLHSEWMNRRYYVGTNSGCAASDVVMTSIPKDYTLFLKGDPAPYIYKRNDEPKRVGRWSVCPQVLLRSDNHTKPADQKPDTPDLKLVVRLNTLARVDHEIVVGVKHSTRYHENEALLSLINGRWSMITISVMDDIPLEDFERGSLVKIYINDTLYTQETIKNASIVENDGQFVFFPDGPLSGTNAALKMTTMNYYNYALSDEDVVKRFNKGFDVSKRADILLRDDAAIFKAQNKTDEYN